MVKSVRQFNLLQLLFIVTAVCLFMPALQCLWFFLPEGHKPQIMAVLGLFAVLRFAIKDDKNLLLIWGIFGGIAAMIL